MRRLCLQLSKLHRIVVCACSITPVATSLLGAFFFPPVQAASFDRTTVFVCAKAEDFYGATMAGRAGGKTPKSCTRISRRDIAREFKDGDAKMVELRNGRIMHADSTPTPKESTTTNGSDRMENGVCLELMIDGVSRACDHTARIADNGAGTVDLISGFSDPTSPKSLIFDFATAQKANLENQYGYAFPVTSLRTMKADQPATRQEYSATGLCFMVRPNPIRTGSGNIKQDVVLMCTAQLPNSSAGFRRLDWKFVF